MGEDSPIPRKIPDESSLSGREQAQRESIGFCRELNDSEAIRGDIAAATPTPLDQEFPTEDPSPKRRSVRVWPVHNQIV